MHYKKQHTIGTYRFAYAAALLTVSSVGIGATLLAGCGAGGGTIAPAASVRTAQATGKATLSVAWPTRVVNGRLIPFAANSIDVHLTSADGTKILGDSLLVRPSGGGSVSATFDKVPVGTATLTATAYPNADGSGVAQAMAQTPVTVVQAQTANVALTLASTIAKVTIAPAATSLTVGQTQALTATATDASGKVVLVTSSTLTWTSSAASIAPVTPGGTVSGVAAGMATITARETESGISGTSSITVVAAPTPTPVPTSTPTPTPAPATFAYEGFAYTAGQYLTGQNGGTGWGEAWMTHGYNSTPSVTVASSLSYLNLATSGGAFQTTSDGPIGDDRNPMATIGLPGQVIYVSTLMRLTDGLTSGSPDTYVNLDIGNIAIGKGGTDSNFDMTVVGGSQYVKTSIPFQQNVTYFVVVRMTCGTTNSTFDLFVDPPLGQSLPATPDASFVAGPPNIADLHYGTSTRAIFDELRVGNTYASVSPTN